MASGDILCVWATQHSTPPASNAATPDLRNNHPVLDFDASTEETIYFDLDALPAYYSGGGLTVLPEWMASSATSGAVVWGGSVERMQAGGTDMDSDSFATEQLSAGVTTNGTSGIINESTITHSSGANMDSLAAGEPFRYRLARKPGEAGDTMTGDAELVRLIVKET